MDFQASSKLSRLTGRAGSATLAAGASPEEVEQQLQVLQRGGFKVRPSRDLVLVYALKQIGNLALELSRMRWIFSHLDISDPDLIIGDHPVISLTLHSLAAWLRTSTNARYVTRIGLCLLRTSLTNCWRRRCVCEAPDRGFACCASNSARR